MSLPKIYVTGGSGFIGRNTIAALLRVPCEVVALQHTRPIFPGSHPQLKIINGAIERPDGFRSEICSCDTLLYLAGATTPASTSADPLLEVEANLLPILTLLKSVSGAGIKRIVSISSGGTIYGPPLSTPIDESHSTNPTSPYGVIKLSIEHMIRLWAIKEKIKYIILRVANPYGPHQHGRGNQGVVGTWLSRISRGDPLVVWGDGRVVRDYIYVRDVADALVLACTKSDLGSGAYNISTGTGANLLEIAQTLSEVTGHPAKLQFEPSRPYDVPLNILCSDRFFSATGWRAKTSLRDGLAETFAFGNNNGPEQPSVPNPGR